MLKKLIESSQVSNDKAVIEGVTFLLQKDPNGKINWTFNEVNLPQIRKIVERESPTPVRRRLEDDHPTEIVITQGNDKFRQIARNPIQRSKELRDRLERENLGAKEGDKVVLEGITFYRRMNNSNQLVWTFDDRDSARVKQLLEK